MILRAKMSSCENVFVQKYPFMQKILRAKVSLRAYLIRSPVFYAQGNVNKKIRKYIVCEPFIVHLTLCILIKLKCIIVHWHLLTLKTKVLSAD